jgi:hypothetical protein
MCLPGMLQGEEMSVTDALIIVGVFLFFTGLATLMCVDLHFARKLQAKKMLLDHEAKMKAIEALKSNVELKLNTSDLKEFLK